MSKLDRVVELFASHCLEFPPCESREKLFSKAVQISIQWLGLVRKQRVNYRVPWASCAVFDSVKTRLVGDVSDAVFHCIIFFSD